MASYCVLGLKAFRRDYASFPFMRQKRRRRRGATSQDMGAAMMKLIATTYQIPGLAFTLREGTVSSVITPVPNKTALTIGKIIAAIQSRVRICLLLLTI